MKGGKRIGAWRKSIPDKKNTIDSTKNSDNPKIKYLNVLKRVCKK